MQYNAAIKPIRYDYINPATGVVYPEPVLLQEAKDYIRVSSTSEDTVITSLIISARDYLEQFTGLSFKPQNITAFLQNDLGGITLPYGPVSSSVTWNNPVAPAISTDLNLVGDQLTYSTSPINFNVSINNYTTGQLYGLLSNLISVSYVGGYGMVGQVVSLQVINGGSGYTVAPTVVFTGTNTTPATAIAVIKGGVVTGVVITNPGAGYIAPPSISFTGTNTTPALAISSLGSPLPETLRGAIKSYVAFLYLSNRGDNNAAGDFSKQAFKQASIYKNAAWLI